MRDLHEGPLTRWIHERLVYLATNRVPVTARQVVTVPQVAGPVSGLRRSGAIGLGHRVADVALDGLTCLYDGSSYKLIHGIN